jgi:DNA-binding NarL/FixJ family response regulator
MTTTHLWLVDDDAELRHYLARALEAFPDGPVLTGSFGTPRSALDALGKGAQLDVALVDLGLPELAGEVLIQKLRWLRPEALLLAFTVRGDDAAVLSALRAGAHGYLTKDVSVEYLLAAIDEALRGGAPLSTNVSRYVVSRFWDASRAWSPVDLLTVRERSVLELFCMGASYREAAGLLDVAESTVQSHVKRIYEKLGVGSKAEAVRMACEAGLGLR